MLKSAQANESTIEAVTSLVSPQAANIERAGFAVLGVVINALDAAGAAAGANGLNVTLDAQVVADIKAIASAVKGAVPVSAAPAKECRNRSRQFSPAVSEERAGTQSAPANK